MEEPDSSWRDSYYATGLDNVLALGISATRRPNASVLGVAGPERPTASYSPPLTSRSQSESTAVSPLTATSYTSMGSSLFSMRGRSNTSPTTVSPTLSSSPQYSDILIPSTETTYCKSCPAKFTGSPQDRKSNLQRHLRTTRRHEKIGGFRCPEQDCGMLLSRSDNLKNHMQTAHGSPKSSKKQTPSKRRRSMDS